ncbi:hypothetical protein B4U80_12093, partial [Leptotrombidium deliense]
KPGQAVNTDVHRRVILPMFVNTRLLKVPANVQGKEVEAILDTGSKRNIISEKFAKQCGAPFESCSVYLRGVNNSIVQPCGEMNLMLRLGKKHFNERFVIVREFPYEMLLGLDFFTKYKVDIQFSKKVISIDNEQFRIDHEYYEQDHYKLQVKKRVRVPMNCEMNIEVFSKDCNATLLVEATEKALRKFGVVTCKSLSSFSNGKGYIRIANVAERDIVIPKDTTIGKGSQIFKCEQG